MVCCGKLQNIIQGNLSWALENLFNVEVLKSKNYDERFRACIVCPSGTWIRREVFLTYIRKHFSEIIRNMGDLRSLPSLPKGSYEGGTELFCMDCKCPVIAKARVEASECVLNRWP